MVHFLGIPNRGSRRTPNIPRNPLILLEKMHRLCAWHFLTHFLAYYALKKGAKNGKIPLSFGGRFSGFWGFLDPFFVFPKRSLLAVQPGIEVKKRPKIDLKKGSKKRPKKWPPGELRSILIRNFQDVLFGDPFSTLFSVIFRPKKTSKNVIF